MTYMKRLLTLSLALCLCVLPLSLALAQSGGQVGVFDEQLLAPGARVEVPIEIRGAVDLYAIDIELSFDPAMLSAEDADPSMDGVQPALGTFLDAGLLLFNNIDLETGIVRFVMSQVNPSEPKSGDGILLVLYLVGKTAGESFLTVNSVTLSDRMGNELPSSGVGAMITVAEDAPVVTSTSVPVQEPTGVIVVPTLAATNTPLPTAVPTATPVPTATSVSAAVPTEVPAEVVAEEIAGGEPTNVVTFPVVGSGGEQEEEGSVMAGIWWILLLVGLAGAGVAVYLRLRGKPGDAGLTDAQATTPGTDDGGDEALENETDQTAPPLG